MRRDRVNCQLPAFGGVLGANPEINQTNASIQKGICPTRNHTSTESLNGRYWICKIVASLNNSLGCAP